MSEEFDEGEDVDRMRTNERVRTSEGSWVHGRVFLAIGIAGG